jgi:hypothetical protein
LHFARSTADRERSIDVECAALDLEQRVHDDRSGARVLEAAHHVEVVAQRRRTDDERIRQAQTEVGRGQIHGRLRAW